MGFYGNITNTSRTQFSFDRIYPSRKAMDAAAVSDGVFIGRYVLVEYEINSNDIIFIDAYKGMENGLPVFGSGWDDNEEKIIGRFEGNIYDPDNPLYIRVPKNNNHYEIVTVDEYYKQVGVEEVTIQEENQDPVTYNYCTFDQIQDPSQAYSVNYNDDVQTYGVSRGYDSTAWQKIITANGEVKYIMIAELNSVVPSFGITADAPSLAPIPPHFDADSTNIYYNLHMPAAWGFRIKAKSDFPVPLLNEKGETIGTGSNGVRNSSNKKIYPSDLKVQWENHRYDPATETDIIQYLNQNGDESTWENDKANDEYAVDGAVYFNKQGIDSEKIVYSSDERYRGWGEPNASGEPTAGYVKDEIVLENTGYSGYQYNSHNNEAAPTPKVDTLELSIMLPSLGDTVAKMWDLVYGSRETNQQIAETSTRNRDIAWEDASSLISRKGLRLVSGGTSSNLEYTPKEADTIAGAINSIHDLMGMIITADSNAHLQDSIGQLSVNRIYYDSTRKKYFRKKKVYKYGKYNYTQASGVTANNFSNNTYYVLNGTVYTPAVEFDSEATYYTRTKVDAQCTYTVANGVTADNFDSQLYYKKNNQNQYIPATTFSNNTTYYTKQLSDQVQYVPVSLTRFEPWKYWYKDYTGDFLHNEVDYVQDNEYDSSKTYYNNFSVAVKGDDLAAYEPDKFYYVTTDPEHPNVLTLVKDVNDTATLNRTYYNIDSSKIKRITQALRDINISPEAIQSYQLYVPGVYYTKTTENGVDRYTLCNDGAPNSNINYYTAHVDRTVDPTVYYVILTDWEKVTDLTADTFLKNYYWRKKIEGEDYSEYETFGDYYRVKEWEGAPTAARPYYIRTEQIEERSDYPTVIDKDNYIPGGNFFPWLVDTFWKKITIRNQQTNKDETGYQILTRSEISYTDIEDLNDVYVFWHKTTEFSPSKVFDLRYFNKLAADNYPDPLAIANTPYASTQTEEELQTAGIDPRKVNEYAIRVQSAFYIPNYYFLRCPNDNTWTDNQNHTWYGYDYIYDSTGEGKLESAKAQLSSEQIAAEIPNSGHEKVLNYVQLGAVGPSEVTGITFYEPNKYYQLLGSDYVLDTNGWDDVTYYEKTGDEFYVESDSSGIYQQGAKWNPEVENIPNTVTISEREETWELVEMPEFARGLTTIHGLLLKIHKMLEFDDADTRDRSTVQGMLNSLEDFFRRVNTLTPGEVTLVNNYGQLESGPVTNDEWVDIDITSTKDEAELNIQHHDAHLEFAEERVRNLSGTHYRDATSSITSTIDKSALTTNINDFELFFPRMDKKGHVIARDWKTITLPSSYRVIKATNSNAASDALNSINNTVNDQMPSIATTINDTLTFAANNKWIKLDNATTSKTVQIGHLVQNISTSSETPNLNIDSIASNLSSDKITTYDFTYDEAGHVRSKKTTTTTLPYGFKTITVNANSSAVSNPVTAASSSVAASTQDTLTFASSNKWIKLSNDSSNKLVEIGHEVNSITDTTPIATINMFRNADITFSAATFTHDEAGHITGMATTTYTLPANSLTGDSWIVPTVSDNGVSLAHATAQTVDLTIGESQARTPNFGDTFNSLSISFDANGHFKESTTYPITIPQPSLTNDDSGNVVTGLSLTPSTGVFVETKADVGTLAITGYSKPNATSALVVTDTVNEALGKLEYKLDDEITNRSNAINGLDMQAAVTAGTGQVIGSIDEADGIVTATLKALTASDIPNIELAQVVDTTNSTNLPVILANKLDSTTAASTYLTIANGLTSSSVAGNYIVEDTDPVSGDPIQVQMNVTYGELYDLMTTLNNKISALTSRVEALEAYHTPAEPEPEPEP